VFAVCKWREERVAVRTRCGQLRTSKLNQATMKRFERALKAHLLTPAAQRKYTAKDADFDVNEWLVEGKIHIAHHPALAWIKAWSREHGHSYRATCLYPSLGEKQYIFDGLHGTVRSYCSQSFRQGFRRRAWSLRFFCF
jgi:hypothetical protein